MPTLGRPFMRTARLAAGTLLLGALSPLGGCAPAKPCDGVSGSCLALKVEGLESFETLEGSLLGSSGAISMGMLGEGSRTLPLTVRMVPPSSVLTNLVTSVLIEAKRANATVASGRTNVVWPPGEHIEASILLDAAAPVPPGPVLEWRTDPPPSGLNSLFNDVWVDTKAQSDFVVAVGDGGIAATKLGGSWTTELSGTNSSLASVYGRTGSDIYAVSQSPNPGVYRRDGAAGTWARDTNSPTLATKGFWSISAGVADGEYWASAEDGKVYHRLASGTYGAVEQALPAGIAVYGIAQAGGAVFAVGDTGYVAYRKDSAAGTAWVQAKVNVSSGDWFQGVWAFDKDNAVAVGTNGFFVRFQGGSWSTTATKIDNSNTELFGVWGQSPSKVWMVGRNGLILRVDGTTVYKLYSQVGIDLYGVYGLSDSNIYAVGGAVGQPPVILHGSP